MTYMLSSLANGKLVVALEVHVSCVADESSSLTFDGMTQGGYNLQAISDSSLAVAKVILGEVPPALPQLTASEVGTETIWQVAQEQSKYWRNVDPRACDPVEGTLHDNRL